MLKIGKNFLLDMSGIFGVLIVILLLRNYIKLIFSLSVEHEMGQRECIKTMHWQHATRKSGTRRTKLKFRGGNFTATTATRKQDRKPKPRPGEGPT